VILAGWMSLPTIVREVDLRRDDWNAQPYGLRKVTDRGREGRVTHCPLFLVNIIDSSLLL